VRDLDQCGLSRLDRALRFHAGWDKEALAAFDENTHIVGTNDGQGRCDCFFMLRRSYIAEHSGVFDEPNAVYHPYEHNWCDTELAEYAKHRGVFGVAPGAVTEHLHWIFGKADREHPNYEKARRTETADHQTFCERRREWVASST
jgi:hypothetical protein